MQFIPRALCLALLAGCVSRADLDEIKKNQKDILAKLGELEKKGPAAPSMPQRPPGPDASAVYSFPVDASPASGPADALVTVIEVSDFQCPYCKRVGPTMTQIKEKYGKDVRIVFKHNPLGFHKRAMPAASASMCAHEQGKFWEMHDQLFENNRDLEDEHVEKYAKAVGLDMGKWSACYKENRFEKQILADQTTASKLGARGTPAFFVNGRYLSGARPFEQFAELIDEELKKAKESGVDRGSYYETAVVQKGKRSI
jgi:protein-disulfide isomerase